jgi:hypothetical protein
MCIVSGRSAAKPRISDADRGVPTTPKLSLASGTGCDVRALTRLVKIEESGADRGVPTTPKLSLACGTGCDVRALTRLVKIEEPDAHAPP